MQHREQDRENKDTEQHTETDTNNLAENSTQDNAQPQHTDNSTYDLHTYSYDFYHEFVAIKNSDTIEIYTILK